MTKIIMNGCNGRMGQVITGIVNDDPEVSIVAGIDVQDNIVTNNYPVFTDIDACDAEADVVIDFSTAKALDKLFDYCERKNLPLVLCTTGLSEEQLKKVDMLSEKIAILRSGNMSLGINTILKTVKEVAKVLAPAGFDIEIVEKHHNQKLDAPSGTAAMLADSINEEFDDSYHYVYERQSVRQKRDKKEIGISSIRGGSIVGDHDIIFAGKDEVVTVSHMAYSRAIFGNGAVAAAKFLSGKTKGLYTMSDVIG